MFKPKNLIILLFALTLFVYSACGKTEGSEDSDQSNQTNVQVQESEEQTPPEETIAQYAGPGSITFTIDEIKATIGNIRVAVPEYQGYFRPQNQDEKYIIVEVELENTSPGRILKVMDSSWKNIRIYDEYQNALTPFNVISVEIVGKVKNVDLRPGDKISDLMVFQRPVDAAQEFTIKGNPGYYVPGDGMFVNDLSTTEFEFVFTRDDIVFDEQ